MASRAVFSTVRGSGLVLTSCWRGERAQTSAETQTSESLWQAEEREVQSGLGAEVEQLQVAARHSGMGLLAYLQRKGKSRVSWAEALAQGRVTVDCEVVTAPDMVLEQDCFVEFVDHRRDAASQTAAPEPSDESKEERLSVDSLLRFLNRVAPMVERELELNLESKAFAGGEVAAPLESAESRLWSELTVDLERRRVVFPDWTRGKHHPGTITRCSVTRTRERVYDVEFEDGGKQFAVREEHIRVVGEPARRTSRRTGPASYAPEMRVHAKVGGRGGVRYLPGRITRVGANNTYDVDCEGGRSEQGLPFEDLLCGLEEGMAVEVRRPKRTQLQGTGVGWSCTGSSVAVSYGRRRLEGWCEVPGAVCVWSVFSRR